MRDNFTELPAALPHWPARLRDSGYTTAYIGKWHMGEDNDAPRPGFDWFVTHKGQGKYFDTEWNVNGAGAKVVPGYYTTVVTDMALDWLASATPRSRGRSASATRRRTAFTRRRKNTRTPSTTSACLIPASAFALDGKPEWMKQRLDTWHGIYGPLFEWRKKFPDGRPEAVKDFENMVHGYWGTVLSVDDSVGRLVRVS